MIQVLRETHDAPEFVRSALLRAGGVNRFDEPNFRAIWGWNRLTWIGGKWEDHDPHTGELLREVVALRREPKYHQLNRWHIERWCPPELYGSPETWARQTLEIEGAQNVPALGPYPSRGEYELAFTLEGPSQDGQPGEFVQLTPAVAERVARAIEWSRGTPKQVRRRAIEDREAREEQEFDQVAEEILA
jgi:hypothetical protein